MTKVLIVDDEVIARQILASIVERTGASVVCCSCAEFALRILEENPSFDLLITDYEMPDMSGRALVGHIRKNEALSKIPVILVSGIIKLSEITDLLKNGVDRFLPKPIDPKELLGYVAQLVKKKEHHASEAHVPPL
jgi:CheY-like chemotaxis protein